MSLCNTLPFDEVKEVHVNTLTGLGASYQMKGFFFLEDKGAKLLKINFKGLAFGGHYGGHNVNIQVSSAARKTIQRARDYTESQVDEILAEVQRKMLNGEMIVEYEKLKPDNQEPLGNLGV